jgi:hypothetical protein
LNPSEFWDLDELRPKLESLSEMQLFRLYFALKKYFWEFEKHPTQAEALCVLWVHAQSQIARTLADFERSFKKCRTRWTVWWSEVNSNCRYRFVNNQTTT